jgi:hypothetical protein
MYHGWCNCRVIRLVQKNERGMSKQRTSTASIHSNSRYVLPVYLQYNAFELFAPCWLRAKGSRLQIYSILRDGRIAVTMLDPARGDRRDTGTTIVANILSTALFQVLLFFRVLVVFVNVGFKLARKASKGPDAIASLVLNISSTTTIII